MKSRYLSVLWREVMNVMVARSMTQLIHTSLAFRAVDADKCIRRIPKPWAKARRGKTLEQLILRSIGH